ncbi:hypothetical protein GCM10025778_15340 [Paeniglutamicibacter antarcticus]|uniref:Ribbon-helix-helix CopG family protein n=1 Tax=Paeniglutamicibacter antarcticus TaxID=494023 RepID=A0ABP9TKA5_9MICC
MTNKPERPETIKRAPRAAADESRDPVDPTPPSQTSPPEKAERTRRRREVTVQFSTRISPALLDTIVDLADEQGVTQRAVIEAAISDYARKNLSTN